MKVLTIVDVVPGASMDQIRSELGHELHGSWELYTAGVLREAYATATPTRVVFVLEAASGAEAAATLGKLPLVAAGLLRVEAVELRPFANWSMLFAKA